MEYPLTLDIIFAYNSSGLLDLKDALIEYYVSIKADPPHYVDLICVLKKVSLTYYRV